MRRISSISVLIVMLLVFAAGCQKPVESTPEEPIAVDTPDNQGASEQVNVEQPVAVDVPLETESPGETEEDQGEAAEEIKRAKIQFDKVVHDYGDMGPSTKRKADFPFKNVGNGVLRIVRVNSTCGCTVPELKKKVYEPGESGVVTIEFHADLRPGKPRKVLHVVTNDPLNKTVALTVKANVVRRVSYEPDILKFYADEENDGIREIVLTSLDDRPFSIESFRATGDALTAEIDPSVEATKFVIKANVDGEKLRGKQRGHVTISMTHPECPFVTIYFDVMQRYTVNPQLLIMFEAEAYKPIQRKIWVLSNYKKPFDVDSIVCKDESVKEVSKREIKDGYELMVEIVPPDAKGQFEHSSDFSIKLTDGHVLPMNYRLFYKETESESDETDASSGG